MDLAIAIHRRVEISGARDPDSLHGLLYLIEGGNSERKISKLLDLRLSRLEDWLTRAREGHAGRVIPSNGERDPDVPTQDPDGLLPSKWQRAITALMLRPDGATNVEIEHSLSEFGAWHSTPDALKRLRAEFKVIGVAFVSSRTEASNQFRYRIIGNDAWRLQKIIANGWAL
jgi:hypothetical protein